MLAALRELFGSWEFIAAYTLLLMWALKIIIGLDYSEFLRITSNELKDFAARDWSVGGLNALAIAVMAGFGALIIVSVEFSNMVENLEALGFNRSKEIRHDVNSLVLFLGVGIVLILSVYFVSVSLKDDNASKSSRQTAASKKRSSRR